MDNIADINKRYMEAVDDFVETVKKDVNVIAVIVQGSLANDIVWEKSDIDVTVIVRDQDIKVHSFSLDADGIVLNMVVIPRTKFIRSMEKSLAGGSMLAKAKVVYTIDDSITEMLARNQEIGVRDAQESAITWACWLSAILEKCQKWLYVKEDYQYCRLYILKAVEIMAGLEICMALEPSRREAIQRAAVLNPKLIERFYTYPMNNVLSRDELEQLINEMDAYLEERIPFYSKLILDYMSDGEIKTATMLSREVGGDGHFLCHLMDYLVSKGVVDRMSETVRLTPKSRPMLEETAYMLIPPINM